jgi:hypothetical protein
MALTLFLGLVVFTHFFSNIWLILTDGRDYQIPAGSNIFTFHPTVMNSGSGGWWIYGEDHQFYYYFLDENKKDSPLAMSKQKSNTCINFNSVDYKSWCFEGPL